MTEKQILRLLLDVADMQYHNTGDKWWLNFGVEVAKKSGRRKHESV